MNQLVLTPAPAVAPPRPKRERNQPNKPPAAPPKPAPKAESPDAPFAVGARVYAPMYAGSEGVVTDSRLVTYGGRTFWQVDVLRDAPNPYGNDPNVWQHDAAILKLEESEEW